MRREEYHKTLEVVFQKLTNEDFDSFSQNDIRLRKDIIEFMFSSIEFLDHSILTTIPFEIVTCLEVALKEWLKSEFDDFIIVTSLKNRVTDFSFDPKLALSDTGKVIKALYDTALSRKLIQINLPKYLANDYLSNVILYHELGHFVDVKFKISESLATNIVNEIKGGGIEQSRKDSLEASFPVLKTYTPERFHEVRTILRNHLAEYFSDLFAAQYVGACGNFYLQYWAGGNRTSNTHPSTDMRIEIVERFLNGKETTVFKELQKATNAICGEELRIRFGKISENEFYELLPAILTDENQLHYLFIMGWEMWKGDWSMIHGSSNSDSKSVYKITNNLIEKSISNFLVQKNWTENLVSQ